MGDMQVGVVANIDDKGCYGMMEDKPVVATSNPTLQVSVSFGRFENDSLSWEKFSAFSPNKYLEEVGKCATPGSVAQKKAYFEAHYKKIAERKAEIMDNQEKQQMEDNKKNASFRSVVTDQGSLEGEVGGSVVDTEEDKHVTDIAAQVKELSVNEETIIVKECQSSVDEVKEEVKDGPRLEKPEECPLVEEEKPEVVDHMQEKPEEVLQIDEKEKTEVREDVTENILCNDTTGNTDETPKKEMEKEKEKPQKLIKKVGNVGINRTRNSPKPEQVRTKPTANKIATSKKTPPSKEIKNMVKPTKKPTAPISKAASPGFSTPRVYKPASKVTSLSTSQSSVKKENASSLLGNKQTAPKSLHMSMSLGPSSASDPSALTSTRKSLIMERMGDKDIVKRAFKSFQKSYDLETSVQEQKQIPAKATTIPSVATRQKENGRHAKASGMEKRSSTSAHGYSASRGLKSNAAAEKQQKELSKSGARPIDKTRLQKNPKAGVVDAKTKRESLTPKAKPVRTLPKVSSEKML